MTLVEALSCWSFAVSFGLWAAAAAAILHLRAGEGDDAGGGETAPMTLIKPIRGLDDAMRRSFETVFAADPGKRLQVLAAMETAEDPAYGLVCRLQREHPDRDLEIVLAGPSGGRMGKIHNMIMALPRAKHPYVVFSDADCCVSEALVRETSAAFSAGADAAFALPYHPPAPGLGGFLFQVAFNHGFSPAVVLAAKLGQLRMAAGAWMGYTKSALERAGGLEQFEREIADDFAISWRVSGMGMRRVLLRAPVIVEETGTSAAEALPHVVKWLRIIRSCVPAAYAALPLGLPAAAAAAAWVLAALYGRPAGLAEAALAAALVTRFSTSLLVDVLGRRRAMSWPSYLALSLLDFGTLGLWLAGFGSTIRWRGTRYRLSWGGRAEVVDPCPS